MTIVLLAIDLGKAVNSVLGRDGKETVVLRRRMRQESILALTATLPPCVVAMEACCGAHHLGRLLEAQGHTVRLMPPEYVRPYVKAQKNDERDAEGIAEAASRPGMRFVPPGSGDQLDLRNPHRQTLHRVRSRLVGARTALINQLRAILLERGHVFPQGRRKLEQALDGLASDPAFAVSARIRRLIIDAQAEWRALDRRIASLDEELAELARNDPAARRLGT
ncbi:IS110 family transposase, partial [Geminicoccaceae bacterium 1502E]|nr:IS110 family transposase [Geminicoccaceae bacterium 1502E]